MASRRAWSALAEALQQWLDHRRDVLLRRSRHRLAEIERRLEMLAGMIVVFLNLDEVIRIIREDDEPKDDAEGALFAHRSAGQLRSRHAAARVAPARGDGAAQGAGRADRRRRREIETLLGDEKRQWQTIATQIRDIKKKYGPETQARQAAHDVRGGARRRRRRSRRRR